MHGLTPALTPWQAAGFRKVKIAPGVSAGGDVRGWSRSSLAVRAHELAGAEAGLQGTE